MEDIDFVYLKSNNIDNLVLMGIDYILNNGIYICTNHGRAQQAYNVSYVLLDPKNRIHWLRQPNSIRYFAKELLAYFDGSLNIKDGLENASSFWKKIADEEGFIFSNYGYYVFYQILTDVRLITQYDWVIRCFLENIDTRKSIININQVYHKNIDTKDFPCTIAIQFYIKEGYLHCSIFSRSIDVFFGLAYDLGFFSFLQELVFVDLKQRGVKDLKLGSTTIKSNFTQIYDMTRDQVLALFNEKKTKTYEKMPEITDAKQTLDDIYNHSQNTEVMKWIYKACSFS